MHVISFMASELYLLRLLLPVLQGPLGALGEHLGDPISEFSICDPLHMVMLYANESHCLDASCHILWAMSLSNASHELS